VLLEGLAELCQGSPAAPRARRRVGGAPGARSLVRWFTSWRGRGERMLELAAPITPPARSAPVLTLATSADELASAPRRAHGAWIRNPRTTF
jgi:hypothetical protein